MCYRPVLDRDVVRVQAVGRLDPHDERAPPPSGHDLPREELGLEGAGERTLQLLDGLLHDVLEALVGILAVDVENELGNDLRVGLRLKPRERQKRRQLKAPLNGDGDKE